MSEPSFTPIVYVKEDCPFCLKVRLFLLESGQLNSVSLRAFKVGDAEEPAIRSELEPHLEKVTFPTAKVAPDRYLNDSDAIVAHFAQRAEVDPAAMPTFRAYVAGLMPGLMTLHRENADLKKKLGARAP